MSELKIKDMAIVIHVAGAEYAEGCGPGTIGTIIQRCLCPDAMFEMIRTGNAVVRFKSAAGPDFCITTNLLRKIEPPGETGSWDDQVFKDCEWNPTKEMSDA